MPDSRPLLRAVFFDAGATLLHPDPPVEAVYAREFSSSGIPFSAEELSSALTRAWKQVHAEKAADRYGGVRGEPEFWRVFLNRVRSFLDGGSVSPDVFARLASHFGDPSSWAVYPDVIPALEALSRRYRLAVVSNWDSQLPRLLERLGLARHFQAVSVSAIEQTGKPDAEIFHRTCRKVGVSPAEALHVGDSLVEDYEGAVAAGLSALLLDRGDRFAGHSARIRGLEELPTRIAGGP